MNTFKAIDTDYIRSSRTIETVLVSDVNTNKIFYVYNFEGYSFRVFDSILFLIDFFKNGKETLLHFENEADLDFYFLNVVLKQ